MHTLLLLPRLPSLPPLLTLTDANTIVGMAYRA